MNPKVDFYFNKPAWNEEIRKLRTIILECGLTEELKWGCPCYTFKKKNIILIHTFKQYCAILFMKGALLKDTADLLVQQTENVQAARQLRFIDLKQIKSQEKIITRYIYEAIEVEKSGLKVEMKETKEFNLPTEFESHLKKMPSLRKAFSELTPGRQRGYLLYFSQAKQAATRESRIKKFIPNILEGKGLND